MTGERAKAGGEGIFRKDENSILDMLNLTVSRQPRKDAQQAVGKWEKRLFGEAGMGLMNIKWWWKLRI
jgi:hypothetical protein